VPTHGEPKNDGFIELSVGHLARGGLIDRRCEWRSNDQVNDALNMLGGGGRDVGLRSRQRRRRLDHQAGEHVAG
jgi:hypothetical protein